MDTNDLIRIVSILIGVAGISLLVFLIAPKQVDDMKMANGYRDFKKKLNWLSVSFILMLVAHIIIDALRIEDCANEYLVSAVVLLRSLMAFLAIRLYVHIYNYRTH